MRFRTFFESAEADLAPYAKNIDALIKSGVVLWRNAAGDPGKQKIFDTPEGKIRISFVRPRDEPRSSISNTNILQYLATLWKGFPKRTMSYFCTRDKEHLKTFGGDSWMIIPQDSVKSFAVANEDFNFFDLNGNKYGIIALIDDADDVFFTLRVDLQQQFSAKEMVSGANEKVAKFRTHPLMTFVMDAAKDFGIEREVKDQSRVIKMDPEKVMGVAEFLDYMVKHRRELADLVEQERKKPVIKAWIAQLEKCEEEIASRGYANFVDVFSDVNPENFGAKVVHSLSQVDHGDGESDEIWFEGGYLGIHTERDMTIEDAIQAIKVAM